MSRVQAYTGGRGYEPTTDTETEGGGAWSEMNSVNARKRGRGPWDSKSRFCESDAEWRCTVKEEFHFSRK